LSKNNKKERKRETKEEMSTTPQLTDIEQFNVQNLVFSKPEIGNIPGQKINFKRIRIGIRYPDQNMGDLIIATPPQLMCFGLQENRDISTNLINGYSLPICLWNRNGPTKEEKMFTDTFDVITDYIKNYLIEHRDDIEKYDLDMADLKKFNPLYWKTEKGKIVEDKGPMIYAKVMWSKKTNLINTIFVDEETNEENDPLCLLNKQCYVTVAIKFESIFIGNKISLQLKLFEVVYKIKDTVMRGLLRPNAIKRNDEIEFEEEYEEKEGDENELVEKDEGSIQLETNDIMEELEVPSLYNEIEVPIMAVPSVVPKQEELLKTRAVKKTNSRRKQTE
jgi:hypothetical protein